MAFRTDPSTSRDVACFLLFRILLATAGGVPDLLAYWNFSHLRSGFAASFANTSRILPMFLSIAFMPLIRGLVELGVLCGTSGGSTLLKYFASTILIVLSAAAQSCPTSRHLAGVNLHVVPPSQSDPRIPLLRPPHDCASRFLAVWLLADPYPPLVAPSGLLSLRAIVSLHHYPFRCFLFFSYLRTR